jgi:glycerophosphoryl diester phosphodiesterase
VADIFPERATLRDPEGRGSLRKGWYAPDFTLAEIKRLDAGSWFNRSNPFAAREEFVGQKILTLEEVIQLFGGKTRLYIEMKYVPFYESLGKDMVGALVSVLKEKKIGPPGGQPGAQPLPPVFVQSFTKSSLLRLRDLAPEYPRIQLLPMEDQGRQLDTKQVTSRLAKEVARYASGVGPAKEMLKSASDVAVFHRAGLQIHPFTFRGSTSASKRSPLDGKESNGRSLEQNIVEEIQRYLRLGIDGGFTDYPPVWKTAAPQLP